MWHENKTLLSLYKGKKRKMAIKSVKMNISKKHTYLSCAKDRSAKKLCSCQNVCPVAHEYTHGRTDTHGNEYRVPPFRVSGICPSTILSNLTDYIILVYLFYLYQWWIYSLWDVIIQFCPHLFTELMNSTHNHELFPVGQSMVMICYEVVMTGNDHVILFPVNMMITSYFSDVNMAMTS